MSLIPYTEPKRPSHYAILQVPRNATEEDVRVAYLRAAKKYHPDRVLPEQREAATIRFQLLAEAFAVLGNGERRAAYDRQQLIDGAVSSAALVPSSTTRRPPSPSPFPRRPTSASFHHHPDHLFASVHSHQRSHARSALAPYGDDYDDGEDEWRSRVGAKGSLHDMLGEVLDEEDPLMSAGRWGEQFGGGSEAGFGGGRGGGGRGDEFWGGAWGEAGQTWERPPQAFGADPWGRRFEGEVNPPRGGRGRTMSASLQEGERRRNGDYHIKNAKHSVEQTEDGSIRWSTMTLEAKYSSGDPHPSSFPQRSSSFSRPSSAPRYPSSSHARHQSHDSPFDLPSHAHQQALFPSSSSFGTPRLPPPSSRPHMVRPDRIDFPSSPALPPPSRFPSLPPAAPSPRLNRLSLTGAAPSAGSTRSGGRPSLSGAPPMGMIQGASGMAGLPAMGGGAVVRRSASARGLRG